MLGCSSKLYQSLLEQLAGMWICNTSYYLLNCRIPSCSTTTRCSWLRVRRVATTICTNMLTLTFPFILLDALTLGHLNTKLVLWSCLVLKKNINAAPIDTLPCYSLPPLSCGGVFCRTISHRRLGDYKLIWLYGLVIFKSEETNCFSMNFRLRKAPK